MAHRTRSLLVPLATCLLVLASCGAVSPSGGGFGLSADQLTIAATPPPATDWTVEVATVRPEIEVIAAFREPPPELGIDDSAPDPSTLPGAHLSEIPGPVPNVTSAQVLGGWQFFNPTFFDNPLVFLVTENHGEWLKVMVPTRPNLQEGWIRADEVELSSHDWRIEISVSTNTLWVYEGDELVVEAPTVGGRDSSPPPLGRFYLNEKIERSPTSAFGSWILSTNAYSDSLEVFQDGMPVFAVHGTNNPSQIGTNISNGCIRVTNDVIELMAERVPVGTPVEVVA